MKSKFIVFMIIAMMFAISSAMAQSTYYNQTVEVDDNPGFTNYTTSFSVSDTITGTIYYGEAMKIGAFSDAYGYGTFQVAGTTTGTEDVNVFIEYADDPETTNANWVLGVGSTDSDLDAIGTTIVEDTVGIVQGTVSFKYKKFGWMRYKYVLGAANNAGKIIKSSTKFMKPEGLKNTNIGKKRSTPDS